ncbi:MAG: metallophosphoesterase, partial [Methanobacteriota archaeon]
EKIVDIVNSLAADVLVFTGDLADGTVAQLKEDVRPLAKLKAPHGCFFITGNHEYYSGVGAWLKEVERLGMKVLLNAHQVIEKGEGRLVIGGIPDPTGKQYSPEHIPNPSKAFSGAPSCDVSILLAHQPRSVFQAAEVGFDLMISGHTHGGQFFPWNFLVTLEQPYLSGMHRHKVKQGEGLVYVSRGTGYWGPPIRLGSRSEVTVFRLVPAARS